MSGAHQAGPEKPTGAAAGAFTVQVDVDERGVIVWTAPIVRKFVGQPFTRLIDWMARLGGVEYELL